MKTAHGWAMTVTATWCQIPRPATRRSGWMNGSRSALTRGPSTASSAGRSVSA